MTENRVVPEKNWHYNCLVCGANFDNALSHDCTPVLVEKIKNLESNVSELKADIDDIKWELDNLKKKDDGCPIIPGISYSTNSNGESS
jgi:hypothetical protein